MDWFEIFKAGDYPQGRFTQADLEQIAGGYDPALHEAPIVIGHPKSDDPAFGWIEALKTENGRLMARPRQLVPEFVKAVGDGLYKKVSVRLSQGHQGRPVVSETRRLPGGTGATGHRAPAGPVSRR